MILRAAAYGPAGKALSPIRVTTAEAFVGHEGVNSGQEQSSFHQYIME